jgi:hypothetical protein
MLRRYARRIDRLLRMLRRWQSRKSRLDRLYELQREIHLSIRIVERRRKNSSDKRLSAKSELRNMRLPKREALERKTTIHNAELAINDYDKVLMLLKSLGDGIAFSLFDRHDIKPMSFKQGPGYLYGKKGYRRELQILRALLTRDYPGVLTDITNSLRHGDICCRVHGFPFPIEVKTSKSSSARSTRQLAAITKVVGYFGTDKVTDWYQPGTEMRRVALPKRLRHHTKALNSVVTSARVDGWANVEVESGLRYAAFSHFRKRRMAELVHGMERPIMHLLNPSKYDGAWSSYFPYTNSIRSVDDARAFMLGEISILVVLDQAAVYRHARKLGFAELADMEKVPAEARPATAFCFEPIQPDPILPYIGVSSHMFGRIFFEFLSLKDFVLAVTHVTTEGLLASLQEQEETTLT